MIKFGVMVGVIAICLAGCDESTTQGEPTGRDSAMAAGVTSDTNTPGTYGTG